MKTYQELNPINYNTFNNKLFGGTIFCSSKNNDMFLKAYRNGKYESLQFMIDNNMIDDYCHQDRFGNTILHYAVVNNDIQFIIYLLKLINNKNELLNKKNKNGDTPLHVAVRKNLTNVSDVLISNGADKNIKNNDGFYVHNTTDDGVKYMDIAPLDTISKEDVAKLILNISESNNDLMSLSEQNHSDTIEVNNTEELFTLLNNMNIQQGGYNSVISGNRKIIKRL
jgi:ankyrin repeat protein